MAALTIRWTRHAIADIDDIYDFIPANNPRTAMSIVDRIDRVITSLTTHPRMGRPGRLAGSRELVVARTPFVVAYRLRGRAVEVLGVIHAARRWPDRL
jgi:addiction module RelE/StbE family toxin